MQWLIIVLRLIHILCGIFWAGSVFFIVSFLFPTARNAGPAGAPFMQRFARSGFIHAVVGAATLTVLSGIGLMWAVSGRNSDWFGSPTGMTLSIGGLAAIIAFGIALSVQRPTMLRLAAIAVAVEAAGGTPKAEHTAQLMVLQPRLIKGARWVAWLLAVAVVCMAVARYL